MTFGQRVASAMTRLANFGVGDMRSWQPDPAIPTNGSQAATYGTVAITNDSAMRNSAVWACLSLRAGLVSSFPVQVFRADPKTGRDFLMTTPPVLVAPNGWRLSVREFLYSTQVDLDRAGNAFGLVTEFSALKTERWPLGIPAKIELLQLGQVSVRRREKDGELLYRVVGINGVTKEYTYEHIWHEKAYTISGLDVGLSPVAYAAFALGGYLSAQEFALAWFNGSGMPAAHLKNLGKQLNKPEAEAAKSSYLASVKAGGVFVSGQDWDLKPLAATTAQTEFINTMQYGVPDIARFFGCPADLIDGAVAGASVTYANLSQRNLQFLITKLGPAVDGREDALSTLTPAPRRVVLDTSTLLQLDHLQQAQLDSERIGSRLRAPSELRARDNLLPYTPEQMQEFADLFPVKSASDGAPTKAPTAGAAA